MPLPTSHLPEFTGKDLQECAERLSQFLRMTSRIHASGRMKCDPFLQCCKTKYFDRKVNKIMTKSTTFAELLVAVERPYTSYEPDLSIRPDIQDLAMLPNSLKAACISELLADSDHCVGPLTPGSYGSNERRVWLVAQIPREVRD